MKAPNHLVHWIQSARRFTLAALCAALLCAPVRAETLLSHFDNFFFFDDQYVGWNYYPTPMETNWTISASGFGGGVVGFYEDDNFTPKIVDASAEDWLEFVVTIESTNVPPVNVTAGPLVLLQDGDGTRWRWAWYGLGAGHHVLTADLDAGYVQEAAGTISGLQLSNLVLFHIQVDPGPNTNVYKITLEHLRAISAPPPRCDTPVSDFDNAGPTGGYASWEGNVPPPQPDNWTITATGFGGGFQDIGPNINALGEEVVELTVTITNANGLVGPIVVFQDNDGTQQTWPWYGLENGRHVLTAPLSGGLPVEAQPGSVPGMDFSNLNWFHVQIDDGGSNVTYTVTFENLRLAGFDPTVTDFAYDTSSGEFHLVWNSRADRTYGVSYVSDITGMYIPLESGIPSGGTLTTNTVPVPAGDRAFLRVFEECQ